MRAGVRRRPDGPDGGARLAVPETGPAGRPSESGTGSFRIHLLSGVRGC